MAINNSIMKQDMGSKAVEYEAAGQMVKLSPNIIKNYLVSGNGNVTDQEVVMFLNLCKYQRLNPFLREAYLIKYGSQPATIVTSKEALTKRAMHNARFKGMQAGVVVVNDGGHLENRTGAVVLPDEVLVGGWAKVFVEGYAEPIEAAASLDEYIGLTKDGKANSQWAKRPATMIRKVALVQALREAFPDDLGGMYTADETGIEETLPVQPVETQPEPVEVEVVEVQPAPESNDVAAALFG